MSDNISRKAVLSILNSFEVMDGHTDQQRAIHMVELLPSTDRNGHWVVDMYDSRGGAWCDNCTTKFRNIPVIGGKVQLDFCPKCGADMRGENDERRQMGL